MQTKGTIKEDEEEKRPVKEEETSRWREKDAG